MSTRKKAFPLRLSPELYAALEKWAADELRSVNGQIEYLLLDAVKRAGRQRGNVDDRPSGLNEPTDVKEARRSAAEDES